MRATFQMIYLNRALDVYNTAIVTPLLYVVFTGCVVTASAILFKEWGSLDAKDVVGNLCGLLIIVAGIFLIQAFRDLDISWRNLPRARKDTTGGVGAGARVMENGSVYSPFLSQTDEEMGSSSKLLTGSGNYHMNRTSSYS